MQGLLPTDMHSTPPKPDAAGYSDVSPTNVTGTATAPLEGTPPALYSWDTRAKMAISLLASIMTIALSSAEGQLVLFVCSAVYALSMRRYTLLAVAYLLVTVMMLMANGCAALVHQFAPDMPAYGLASMAVPFLRCAVMMNVVLPLAFTSPIQSMLTALKSLRLSYCLYIPLAVMIRFIPTFLFDMRQMGEALRIRGYRPGIKQCVLHPLLTMRLLTLPLLFRSLKTSEDLGVAAEMKGLGARGTVRPYKALAWNRRDTLVILAALAICAAAALCHYIWGTTITGGMR